MLEYKVLTIVDETAPLDTTKYSSFLEILQLLDMIFIVLHVNNGFECDSVWHLVLIRLDLLGSDRGSRPSPVLTVCRRHVLD